MKPDGTWPTEFTFKAAPPKDAHDAQANRELDAILGGRRPTHVTFKVGALCQMVPRPTDEEYERLKASVRAEGFANPMIVRDDDTGEILDGWSRMRVAHELGIGLEVLRMVPLSSLPHMERDRFKGRKIEFVLLASERRGLTVARRRQLAEDLFKLAGKRKATQQEIHHLVSGSPKAPPRDSVYTPGDINKCVGRAGYFGVSPVETLGPKIEAAVEEFVRHGRTYDAKASASIRGNGSTPAKRAAFLTRHFTSTELAEKVGCASTRVRKWLSSNNHKLILEPNTPKTKASKPEAPNKQTPVFDFKGHDFLKDKTADQLRELRSVINDYLKHLAKQPATTS